MGLFDIFVRPMNSMGLFRRAVKAQMQAQYAEIPGRIITMALESVDYSEDRACQILKIVQQDDAKPAPAASAAVSAEVEAAVESG